MDGLDEHFDSLICAVYEDQRPLKGAAGALDWRLRGFLSRYVIAGNIEGKADELVYVPIVRRGTTQHLLLVGLGKKSEAEALTENDERARSLLKRLVKAVAALKLDKVAISRSSFPFFTETQLKKAFAGHSLEIVQ